MKAVRRFFGLFSDSPTYGRDQANLFSGFTIGTAALVLNGAVLFMVLPLMLYPDDSDFRMLTENLEFGQLLALILLGGATVFATFLIPLRMSTVFMGPRVGRYFDQIVLSGITPFRFVIGKATSQNLFIGLALFLLLPYLILSIALGGMDAGTFFCGVLIVWLYSMMLAAITLWVSLYFNEIFGAFCIIAVAVIFGMIGFAPVPFNPMVMTPIPVLIHSIYTSIPMGQWFTASDYTSLFVATVVTMSSLTAAALFAIYVGPLYGIVTENSTFGEVVRAGDSKKKRWLRLRPHIQRSSEIAFFYENRGDAFRRSEGLIRWGAPLAFMLLLSATAYTGFYLLLDEVSSTRTPSRWFAEELHISNMMIHGFGMLLAIFVFSHSKNNLYLRVPFFRGRQCEVSRMDTICFVTFLVCSTVGAIAMPLLFERHVAQPRIFTLFDVQDSGYQMRRFFFEGVAVLSIIAVQVFLLQKLISHSTWLKSLAMFACVGGYLFIICIAPFIFAAVYFEFNELRQMPWFASTAPVIAMFSPFTVFAELTDELGRQFPTPLSTLPFYLGQGLLFILLIVGIRMKSRRLKPQYRSSGGVQ